MIKDLPASLFFLFPPGRVGGLAGDMPSEMSPGQPLMVWKALLLSSVILRSVPKEQEQEHEHASSSS